MTTEHPTSKPQSAARRDDKHHAHDAHAPSRLKFAGASVVAILCGGLVALQSRINGQLGHELGDGFLAAIISFGSGLILLSIIVAAAPTGRRGLARVARSVRHRHIPWWYVAGGIAGGIFVLAQGLTAAILGVALFTVAVVAGQTLSGLLIDARGMGTVAPKRVTAPRIIGTALALVAVGIAVGPQLRGEVPAWMLILPFIVGLFLGWQQAVNGQVKNLAESALTATWVNFLGGSSILVIMATVHTAIVGWPKQFPTEPWLYVGGIIGMAFIGGFAAVVRTIGVLVLSLCAISGQLLMSLTLDIVAPTEATTLAATTVVGTLLTLVAAAIASIAPRRRSS
jgi:transporter family-2 protein